MGGTEGTNTLLPQCPRRSYWFTQPPVIGGPWQALIPDTTPRRESHQQRARLRAGNTFSRQRTLRHIRQGTLQHFRFLLQQADAFIRFTQFGGLC